MDIICESHGLSKEYLKNQMRHMERSYQERIEQLNSHFPSHEWHRHDLIAELRWNRKTL